VAKNVIAFHLWAPECFTATAGRIFVSCAVTWELLLLVERGLSCLA